MRGHPVIKLPNSAEGIQQTVEVPNKDVKVWKFVDLQKFLAILTEGTLFFPTLENLCSGDPYECALWPKSRYSGWSKERMLRRALQCFIDLRTGLFLLEEQQAQQQGLIDFLRRSHRDTVLKTLRDYERQYYRRFMVCNCWHANTCESDAMWKVYSASTGVAIESTLHSVARAIRGYSPSNSRIKGIRYMIKKVHYTDELGLAHLPKGMEEFPFL